MSGFRIKKQAQGFTWEDHADCMSVADRTI